MRSKRLVGIDIVATQFAENLGLDIEFSDMYNASIKGTVEALSKEGYTVVLRVNISAKNNYKAKLRLIKQLQEMQSIVNRYSK